LIVKASTFSHRTRHENHNNPPTPENGLKGLPGASNIDKNQDSDLSNSGSAIANYTFFAFCFQHFLTTCLEKALKTERLSCKLAQKLHGGGLCAQRTGYQHTTKYIRTIYEIHTMYTKWLNKKSATFGGHFAAPKGYVAKFGFF
jgi:hypothetical protein